MRIVKKVHFHSSHVLPKHPGKCSRLHGHTYHLEVGVDGQVDHETGMVLDYDTLKKIVGERVLDILDHRHINEVFVNEGWPGETTAENIAMFIWKQLDQPVSQLRCLLAFIRLWETQTSAAEVHRDTWQVDDIYDTGIVPEEPEEA